MILDYKQKYLKKIRAGIRQKFSHRITKKKSRKRQTRTRFAVKVRIQSNENLAELEEILPLD